MFFNELFLCSLTLHLLGYSCWFVASHFYPQQCQEYTKWYGFAQYKEQNIFASALGIGAACISMAAIALPILALPAAWMFFLGNVFWTIGEYHKLKNPLLNEAYSKSHQKSYVGYALATTGIGLIAALTTTLVFSFPALSIPFFLTSGIVSIGLGIVSLQY